jgi:3-oxoacyl-[acyl-carrier-protein] synthase III
MKYKLLLPSPAKLKNKFQSSFFSKANAKEGMKTLAKDFSMHFERKKHLRVHVQSGIFIQAPFSVEGFGKPSDFSEQCNQREIDTFFPSYYNIRMIEHWMNEERNI